MRQFFFFFFFAKKGKCNIFLGALTLVVTNPVWMTKTRLCLQYETQQTAYRGMWHALRDVYQRNGIRGLYKVR